MTTQISLNDIDAKLIVFLRGLADGMESGTLSGEQIGRIGEFFMAYCMKEDENQEKDEQDFMKFLTVGWYIYNCLLQNEDINENERNIKNVETEGDFNFE